MGLKGSGITARRQRDSRSCAAGVTRISARERGIYHTSGNGTKRPVSFPDKRKEQEMRKIYCDMCGTELKEYTTVIGSFYYRMLLDSTQVEDKIEICFKCFGKVMDVIKGRETSKKAAEAILKRAEKIAREAVEETVTIPIKEALPEKTEGPVNLKLIEKKLSKSAKRPAKNEAPDPEKKTRNNNIDDGKIWALAHAKQPWTMEQIAEEMGIPKSTVYYHLKRMREERGEV